MDGNRYGYGTQKNVDIESDTGMDVDRVRRKERRGYGQRGVDMDRVVDMDRGVDISMCGYEEERVDPSMCGYRGKREDTDRSGYRENGVDGY